MKINNKNKIVKNNSLSFIFNGIKKYSSNIIKIFSIFIIFFSFASISLAAVPKITSVVKGDTVTIKVECSECENKTAGKIRISTPGSDIPEKTFTTLQKNNPLTFTFTKLRLNVTYEITVWATGNDVYLYYSNGNGKTTVTSSFDTIPDGVTPTSDNTTFKTVVTKETPKATVSITCFMSCGAGLEGSFTLKGDNYSQTSAVQSLKTNIPTNFVFTGLENGKTYTVSGTPYNTNNTKIVFRDFSFLMDDEVSLIANDVVSVEPSSESTGSSTSNNFAVYKLLAPIGNLTEAPEDIGSYFNTIFNIALGLCAVLAVIMIVIGGVQYMGDESIFGKTEAKDRITKAIFGLLIALGSYALLNTINPDLLGGRGVSIGSVSAGIDPETELAPWTGTSTVTGTTKTCTEGYVNVTTYGSPKTINVCKTIATGLQNLINTAKSQNIILSGSGARTYDEQVYLRQKNGCKPNIYTSPSKSCSPETARPGFSKHESGKAVDFNCNGASMVASGGKNSVCFKWLSLNASKIAGLKNLASESWHWSDDGH